MRRFALLLALLMLALPLAACTPEDTGEDGTTEATTTTKTEHTTTEAGTTTVGSTTPTEDATTTESTSDPEPSPTPTFSVPASPIKVTEAFVQKSFAASSGLVLPYRLFLPANYNPEADYPVVLLLHGSGERGTDNTAQLKNGVQKMFDSTSSPAYGAIVIVPQCPKDMRWVEADWTRGNYDFDTTPISRPLSAVVELLSVLESTLPMDTDRIYVTGLSMGGFGTWDLLMRDPDRFAAGLPICGGADPDMADAIKQLPIRTFHGSNDPTVPVGGTRAMAEALQSVGAADFSYEEIAGGNHLIWDPIYARRDVIDWLFAQDRSPDHK